MKHENPPGFFQYIMNIKEINNNPSFFLKKSRGSLRMINLFELIKAKR